MASALLDPPRAYNAPVPRGGNDVAKSSGPRQLKPWEVNALPDDLDFVLDPDELCRKLERYKFAQEECARRRQQRLLDDEKRRKMTEETKLKDGQDRIERQRQLDMLIPAIQIPRTPDTTNSTVSRFISIEQMVQEKRTAYERVREVEQRKADDAQARREAERKRKDDARRQREEARQRSEEELKRKELEVMTKRQSAMALGHGESRGQSKVGAFIAYQRPFEQETQHNSSRRKSFQPPLAKPSSAKTSTAERSHDSATNRAKSGGSKHEETVPYHHTPRNAKTDFERTATSKPLRRENVHQLALPLLEKRSSIYQSPALEWGESRSPSGDVGSPLTPPLNWLNSDDRLSYGDQKDSLLMTESDSDNEPLRYRPNDRPDWAQGDQRQSSTRQSWAGKPSFTPLKNESSRKSDPKTTEQTLSPRKSILGLKSFFGK